MQNHTEEQNPRRRASFKTPRETSDHVGPLSGVLGGSTSPNYFSYCTAVALHFPVLKTQVSTRVLSDVSEGFTDFLCSVATTRLGTRRCGVEHVGTQGHAGHRQGGRRRLQRGAQKAGGGTAARAERSARAMHAQAARSALWHTAPCTAADAGAARTACTVCAACVQASTAYPRELSWWERGHHHLAVFLLTVPLGISRRSLLGLGLLRPLPRGPPRVPGEVQGCRGRRQGRAPHRHRQQRPSGHAQERCDARR